MLIGKKRIKLDYLNLAIPLPIITGPVALRPILSKGHERFAFFTTIYVIIGLYAENFRSLCGNY